MSNHLCLCGSGLASWWEYDGNGYVLCSVCPKCKAKKLSRYPPEILKPYMPE